MIAHVSGEIVEKSGSALIIDVGGLGYEVLVAAGDFEVALLGQQMRFYTYDHLRENSHELFGFSQLPAKRLFELLISVSGVGPKMALAILSLGAAESIRNAIATGDSAFVQRASGVGKRLAERIVLDLKEKVGAPGMPSASVNQQDFVGDDAASALLALGYNLQQVNEALAQIESELETQTRIKQALRYLSSL